MNRERAKELLPIIQAYAEGKKVQYMDSLGAWKDVADPTFDPVLKWRVKPEPMEIWVRIDAVGQLDWIDVYYDKEHAKKECGNTPLMHFREVTE